MADGRQGHEACSNFRIHLADNLVNAMSLLPVSGLMNSGQMIETQAGAALQGSPGTFSKVRDGTGSPYEPAPSRLGDQPLFPAKTSLSTALPSGADVLKPKLEYAGNSLSVLNARVATMEPSAAESLENRLDVLNTQFRVLGDNLEQSAAKNDPMQLLRLQNDIYQLDEALELVSKVVDQATSGVRSLLQTQI